jgi:hypothetical protein
MVAQRFTVGLLVPSRMEDAGDGERFLVALHDKADRFSPEFYGNFEPIKTPFASIEECLKNWRCPFLWKRKRPFPVQGAVWHGGDRAHTGIYVRAAATRQAMDDARRLLATMSAQFETDLGYVHPVTDSERNDPEVSYDMWYPIDIGITTHDVHHGLPNLCWCTLFGPPYVELIGRESFRRVRAFAVSDFGEGSVCLQLTSSIEDVRVDYPRFRAIREAAKAALGLDLFRGNPGGGTRSPRFALFQGSSARAGDQGDLNR